MLLEDEYKTTNDHGQQEDRLRHITCRFDKNGIATISGVYQDFYKQTRGMVKKRVEELRQETLNSGLIDEKVLVQTEKALKSVENLLVAINMKESDKQCRFAKEFFITEKGEVIKIMALLTPNDCVRQKLREQKVRMEKYTKEKGKILTGMQQDTFISILRVKND